MATIGHGPDFDDQVCAFVEIPEMLWYLLNMCDLISFDNSLPTCEQLSDGWEEKLIMKNSQEQEEIVDIDVDSQSEFQTSQAFECSVYSPTEWGSYTLSRK